jgi:hypothetical protein
VRQHHKGVAVKLFQKTYTKVSILVHSDTNITAKRDVQHNCSSVFWSDKSLDPYNQIKPVRKSKIEPDTKKERLEKLKRLY